MKAIKLIERPGYFGRKKDEIIAGYDKKYGKGEWNILWSVAGYDPLPFEMACICFYELSYLKWFKEHPEELDIVASYRECMDNAETNVESGCDYTKQEAFSTHIQDIAIRNVLRANNRKFTAERDELLVIRSADSTGYKYGPGNIPFVSPNEIQIPSKCPRWAKPGSVEDFWQSNKWIGVYV